ncbi:hypothetical protein CsatB_008722 [Cannabis sativa]|uniref:Chloroplast thylakoid membrane n=1 Tax=Cannabis sativa TaxID=3483 RepID=A0A7J6DLD0_CANSA|nr:uncharacterized protein LOC115700808 [Cannabis sativa]KAF4346918.1 hypothetical protein G4B88_025776 [Cannabis sativa]KAF4357280.1 hypothetical protein F8388_002788 [Cannabis sativa]
MTNMVVQVQQWRPALSTFPPNSKSTLLFFSPKLQHHHHLQPLPKFSRRDLASLSFLALLPSLSTPAPATAFSIGISGPKDWLKDQKKKSSKFLLAPIDASRESLRSAYLLLNAKDSDYSEKDMEEIQSLLRSAARDCVIEERNSFVAFQANTGVEVCTFRLIVKNAASLLGDKDPLKLEAEAILADLIRSFSSLQTVANEADIQLPSERQRIADSLTNAISFLDKFEQGVKDCLEI